MRRLIFGIVASLALVILAVGFSLVRKPRETAAQDSVPRDVAVAPADTDGAAASFQSERGEWIPVQVGVCLESAPIHRTEYVPDMALLRVDYDLHYADGERVSEWFLHEGIARIANERYDASPYARTVTLAERARDTFARTSYYVRYQRPMPCCCSMRASMALK